MEKLIIFDLDGTLIHSLPDIAFNLNLALEKFGYARLEHKDVMRFIGNGARRLVKDSMGEGVTEKQVDECLAFYNELYTNSNSPRTGLFDGVMEMLISIREKGYKLAILTNKPQLTTNEVVKVHFKNFSFDLVVGQSPNVKCKPDKSGAEYIMKTLDVLPENCYLIGDGETDYLTAKNAGVKSISVLWGYRSKEQLMQVGSKTFAENPKDVLKLLGI